MNNPTKTETQTRRIPFIIMWHNAHETPEYHQLRASGGALMCPAIIAGCGRSERQPGKFWWNARETPVSARSGTQYENSIDQAKEAAEAYLKPYLDRMREPATDPRQEYLSDKGIAVISIAAVAASLWLFAQ